MTVLPLIEAFDTVVLAHGDFPTHPAAVQALRCAKRIVCCDGAIADLLHAGLEPEYLVGDLDSISPGHRARFADRIFHLAEQESNDLTKAVRLCFAKGLNSITILGATGKREDHTLGNMALLAEYVDGGNVQMVTDYGVLNAVAQSTVFESFGGQQVSLFRMSEEASVTLEGLKYPLQRSPLQHLWMGTLNEALGSTFTVKLEMGKLVVFREHRPL